jgi:hypothetical protein
VIFSQSHQHNLGILPEIVHDSLLTHSIQFFVDEPSYNLTTREDLKKNQRKYKIHHIILLLLLLYYSLLTANGYVPGGSILQ